MQPHVDEMMEGANLENILSAVVGGGEAHELTNMVISPILDAYVAENLVDIEGVVGVLEGLNPDEVWEEKDPLPAAVDVEAMVLETVADLFPDIGVHE